MTNYNQGEAGGGIVYGEGVDFNKPGSISVLGESGGTEVIGEGSEISIFKEDTVRQINNLI